MPVQKDGCLWQAVPMLGDEAQVGIRLPRPTGGCMAGAIVGPGELLACMCESNNPVVRTIGAKYI